MTRVLEVLDYGPDGIPSRFPSDRGRAPMFGLDLSSYRFECWPKVERYEAVRRFVAGCSPGVELPNLSGVHELKSWSNGTDPVVLVTEVGTGQIVGHVNAGSWMSVRGRVGCWDLLIVHPDHPLEELASALMHKLHWILATMQCRVLWSMDPVACPEIQEVLRGLGYRVPGQDGHMAVSLRPLFVEEPARV